MPSGLVASVFYGHEHIMILLTSLPYQRARKWSRKWDMNLSCQAREVSGKGKHGLWPLLVVYKQFGILLYQMLS